MNQVVEKNEAHRRLGKPELGRHAFEACMPTRVTRILQSENSSNKLSGVVPLIARILEPIQDIEVAYLCRSTAVQIWAIKSEGNFCGYRNIQMLVEAMQSKTVLEIQTLIERAWDMGHNAHGREETGGIIGTRKHIGTPEAQALLESLDIQCKGDVFSGDDVHKLLLDSVEQYFSASHHHLATSGIRGTVVSTDLPPIYLQMPKHSITIVGLERLSTGKRRLLVFDPGRPPPSAYRSAATSGKLPIWPESLLKWRYRRDETSLKARKRYETLRITDNGARLKTSMSC